MARVVHVSFKLFKSTSVDGPLPKIFRPEVFLTLLDNTLPSRVTVFLLCSSSRRAEGRSKNGVGWEVTRPTWKAPGVHGGCSRCERSGKQLHSGPRTARGQKMSGAFCTVPLETLANMECADYWACSNAVSFFALPGCRYL